MQLRLVSDETNRTSPLAPMLGGMLQRMHDPPHALGPRKRALWASMGDASAAPSNKIEASRWRTSSFYGFRLTPLATQMTVAARSVAAVMPWEVLLGFPLLDVDMKEIEGGDIPPAHRIDHVTFP